MGADCVDALVVCGVTGDRPLPDGDVWCDPPVEQMDGHRIARHVVVPAARVSTERPDLLGVG
jgi:hypothetical protein